MHPDIQTIACFPYPGPDDDDVEVRTARTPSYGKTAVRTVRPTTTPGLYGLLLRPEQLLHDAVVRAPMIPGRDKQKEDQACRSTVAVVGSGGMG